MKHTVPMISTFPHGSSILYVMQRIPERPFDITVLTSFDCKCVATEVNINGGTFMISIGLVQCRYSANWNGSMEAIPALARGGWIICVDFNAIIRAGNSPDQKEGGRGWSKI